jgi:hypothetical protein
MPATVTERTLSIPAARLIAAYAAAIVVALLLLETTVRVIGPPVRLWYPLVATWNRPIRVLFVGSSRVQAAVDPARVTARLGPAGDRIDVNLGEGFSTIIEHTLGLRDLGGRGLLRGATVFVEIPGGAPDASRWTDRWYYTEMPDLFAATMRPGDLGRLWASDHSREDKFTGTARTLLQRSLIFTYHEFIRVRFLTAVDAQFRALSRRLAGAGAAAPPTPDLREGGGVRTDFDDRLRIRAEAVVEGQNMLREQRLVTDWNDLVVGTLVSVVQNSGGNVVFFETPLSPPMRLASETAIGLENRRRFLAQAERWGARTILLQDQWPAESFPDMVHLSAAASGRFTDELIAAWRR